MAEQHPNNRHPEQRPKTDLHILIIERHKDHAELMELMLERTFKVLPNISTTSDTIVTGPQDQSFPRPQGIKKPDIVVTEIYRESIPLIFAIASQVDQVFITTTGTHNKDYQLFQAALEKRDDLHQKITLAPKPFDMAQTILTFINAGISAKRSRQKVKTQTGKLRNLKRLIGRFKPKP